MSDREIRRALSAFSSSAVLDEVEEMMGNVYFAQWRASRDAEAREQIYTKLLILEDLFAEFSAIITDNRETER